MDAIPLDLRLICRRGLHALLLAAPVILALLLVARRLAGALVEPLPILGWLAIGVLLALWLHWFRRWISGHRAGPLARLRIESWMAPAAAILVALLLWLPGTAGLSLVGFMALVALGGSEASVLVPPLARRTGAGHRPSTPPAVRPMSTGEPLPPAPGGPPADHPADEMADECVGEESDAGLPLASTIVQQLVRRREPGQAEAIEGSLRANFAAGQRTVSAHVAICPPFELAPRCQAAVAAGPSAEVRVATALPFGVRFEIKLARAATEAVDVVIELAIQSNDAAA